MKPTLAVPGQAGSIGAYFVTLALVIAMPVIGLVGWLLAAIDDKSTAGASAELQLAAAAAGSRLDMHLNQYGALLEELHERPTVRALDAAQCDPKIEDFADNRSDLHDLTLFDAAGRVICAAAIDGHLPPKLLSPTLKKSFSRADDFIVGSPEQDPQGGVWLLPLVKPVFDLQGDKAGLLVARVDLLKLQRTALEKVLPVHVVEVVEVVGPQSRVLMRSRDASAWIGRTLTAERVAAPPTNGTTFGARGDDGQPWFILRRRIGGSWPGGRNATSWRRNGRRPQMRRS
jgi:hypothetical protein